MSTPMSKALRLEREEAENRMAGLVVSFCCAVISLAAGIITYVSLAP